MVPVNTEGAGMAMPAVEACTVIAWKDDPSGPTQAPPGVLVWQEVEVALGWFTIWLKVKLRTPFEMNAWARAVRPPGVDGGSIVTTGAEEQPEPGLVTVIELTKPDAPGWLMLAMAVGSTVQPPWKVMLGTLV